MGFDKLSGTICTAQRRLRSGTGKYVSTSLHPCQFSASLFSYITHEFKINFSPNWRVRSPMGFDKLSGTICTAPRRLRSGTGKYVSTSLHPCQFFSYFQRLISNLSTSSI